MNKVTCECGHDNPFGTYLCESCGKPLKEEKGLLANMRYEGVARRSQTYSKRFIDKIWNFFSSVKVGVWLIFLVLASSSLGTLFPQEIYIPPEARGDTALFYEQEYGVVGKLYYQLGFHNLYSSWWYLLLIAGLGISLVIASLDRFVPLFRALRKQRVTRHTGFMERQRLYSKTESSVDFDPEFQKASELLKNKRYNVRTENNALFAEKGRFARWGPYVNHIGLIIFLIGAMLRFFPEMYLDEYIWIREGETEVISGTDGEYFIRNNQFTVELYDEDDELFQAALEQAGGPVIRSFETDATLLKRKPGGAIGSETELEEVLDHKIRVNHPLSHDGFTLYQVDYKMFELSTFDFRLEDAEGEFVSDLLFSVDLNDPQERYEFDNGFVIEIIEYFPNFLIDDNQEPTTLNRIPDNPRIIFEVFPPDSTADESDERGEISMIGVQVNEALNGPNDYTIRMADANVVNVTGLTIRRDKTLPIIGLGGIIFMIGLVQGSYWHHRRIWIQRKDGTLYLAGHANKNWQALKQDFNELTVNGAYPVPVDQVEEEEKRQENEIEEKNDGVKKDDDTIK